MITIGVTGHRPHRLAVPVTALAARVRETLRGLLQHAPADRFLDILSPLAEGSDRIVAAQALALGQRLSALSPFCLADYEATFSDPAATGEFRRLWQAADARAELNGSTRHAEASYMAVGMVTLARSDLVLTIWDGRPAQGRGGTPEILQNAVAWGIPVLWIDASADRPPVLLWDPQATGRPPQLDVLAARPRALDASAYQALVLHARRPPSAP
jgi:hypothetical protein